MNQLSNHPNSSNSSKDFWDSLHQDILSSNHSMIRDDYLTSIERSFVFSLAFRSCPSIELAAFQKILSLKDNGYVIILEIDHSSQGGTADISLNEIELHHYIKSNMPQINMAIGPLMVNRFSILITEDNIPSEEEHKTNSIRVGNELIRMINNHFHCSSRVGIGSLCPLNTIYSSFIEALSSLHYDKQNSIHYYKDINRTSDSYTHFDYLLAEKHLLEAIRLRKTEAYDYFALIMDWIRPLNDDTKRNKIIEILVLSNHAMRLDSSSEIKFINYAGYTKQFMELEGEQLIEFAYQSFILITSYVKPQSTIDYSNHIVKATKEYLENHYAEDISLEDVAAQANISPQYFSKLIKKTTGFNFIDWLSTLRVKKAKELLTNSEYTVKEVCFMVGYKDPNYFSRIFKKRIGITPSEFAKTRNYLNN